MIDRELEDDIRRQIRTIRNADRVKTHANSVDTTIVENVHGRGETRGFSFAYDEPRGVVGGQNRGPRPLEYFLAGWAFCQQVMYARSALLTGTDLTGLSMAVSGRIDPRSSVPDLDTPAGFVGDELSMTTRIESSADPADVRALVHQAQELCHAHASLRSEMTLETDVLLNGQPLDV